MSNNNNSSSGGIGFAGLLAIVFITLKLCKVIDWSWWWVLCPLWGPVALVIGYYLFKLIILLLADIFSKNAGKSLWQIRLGQTQKRAKENK